MDRTRVQNDNGGPIVEGAHKGSRAFVAPSMGRPCVRPTMFNECPEALGRAYPLEGQA